MRAARRLEDRPPEAADAPLDFAFALLDDVSWTATRNAWTSRTQWRIVYDVDKRTIHFRTHANPKRRRIDLNAIDFACNRPARVPDVNANFSGDVTDRFVDYTRQMNRDLTAGAFNQTVCLPRLPEDVFDNIARYPETFVCNPRTSRRF